MDLKVTVGLVFVLFPCHLLWMTGDAVFAVLLGWDISVSMRHVHVEGEGDLRVQLYQVERDSKSGKNKIKKPRVCPNFINLL